MSKPKQDPFKGRKHPCPTCQCNRVAEMKLIEREVIGPIERAFKDKGFVLQFVGSER
jgi:hypothetical protein